MLAQPPCTAHSVERCAASAPGLFIKHGSPEHIRRDNYSEFIAKKLRDWPATMEVAPMYILPGSPWENEFVESFNGTMVNEVLNREIFDSPFNTSH